MIKETTIDKLKFDNKNHNRHTQKGLRLVEKSLSKLGFGRSIVLDENNNIISGNGVVETAGQLGFNKVKIVETDGTEIIAVKRTDVKLNSKKGRELAISDNHSAKESINLDFDIINDLSNEFDIDLNEWELEPIEFDNSVNFSDKNKEIDVNDFSNDKYFFKLEYTQEEYEILKDRLERIGKTPEQIFYESLISL